MKLLSPIFPLHNKPPIENTQVSDLTNRDNIGSDYRYIGMKVYVISENKEYRLVGGITNSDWEEIQYGGSSSTLKIETFTLTSTDLSNGKITVQEIINQNECYSVNLNGSILFQGNDYTIQNQKDIVFTFSQNQLLTEGDMIQVIYKF